MFTYINDPILTATPSKSGRALTILILLIIISVAFCVIIKIIKNCHTKQARPKVPSAPEKADKSVKLVEKKKDMYATHTDHYRCRLCGQNMPITESLCSVCRAPLGIYGEIISH